MMYTSYNTVLFFYSRIKGLCLYLFHLFAPIKALGFTNTTLTLHGKGMGFIECIFYTPLLKFCLEFDYRTFFLSIISSLQTNVHPYLEVIMLRSAFHKSQLCLG